MLFIFNKLIFLFVIQLFVIRCYSEISGFSNKTGTQRQKRTLNFYFPYNSCYALAVVLSLPLDLPGRSVFFSYNFETNFYYPYYDNAYGIVPLPFTWIDEPGANAGTKHRIDLPPANRQFGDYVKEEDFGRRKSEKDENEIIEEKQNLTNTFKDKKEISLTTQQSANNKTKNKIQNILMLLKNYFLSRRRFYKLMESKMDRSGLKGHDCLLKAICETSEGSIGFHNGVIGSVVEILFLPSASKDEKLPKRYYRAEANGKSQNCNVYNHTCPKSIFDFISKII